MGAWSHESFGNDTACDWAGDLQEGDDIVPVEAALDAVLEVGDDYLEAPEASEAIAAAEVVARLQGHFGLRDAYSESLDQWIAQRGITPSADLATKARQVLDRILSEPSELLELWEEDGEPGEWRAAVIALKDRIAV
jgi:hypothetical protein